MDAICSRKSTDGADDGSGQFDFGARRAPNVGATTTLRPGVADS